jgi:mRNA-capping enzyme
VSSVPFPDEAPVEERAAVLRPDDLLGEPVPDSLSAHVLQLCRQLTAPSAEAAEQAHADFPGSQPISLSRANLDYLSDASRSYMVSWKADGTRYLVLLHHGGAYLVDRASRVRRVQACYPAGGWAGGRAYRPVCTRAFTLLDGEMVVDAAGQGQPARRRFLAYDCVSLGEQQNAKSLAALPFRERYRLLEDGVTRPKHEFSAASRGRYDTSAEPFSLELKPFFEADKAEWLLSDYVPQLLHPCDGLIFQPGAEAYTVRTAHSLLKWKLPELNTVDFFFEGDGVLSLAAERGSLRRLAEVRLSPELLQGSASPLNAQFVTDHAEPGEAESLVPGLVAECTWDGTRGCWSLLRVRRDKQHPNHESVFARVWESICDDLQLKDVKAALARALLQQDGAGDETMPPAEGSM